MPARRPIPSVFAGVAVTALALCGTARAELGEPEVSIARNFGYVIGDLVPYDVDLRVDRSWRLQRASIPTPGAPLYWLELRRVDVAESEEADARRYRLHLVYQVFYAPIEARTRQLPGFALGFDHDGSASEIAVPPLTITMSPLREVATGTDQGQGGVSIQADRATPRLSLRAPSLLAAGAAAVGLAALAVLARQRAWWPFARRGGRAFAAAARALQSRDWDRHGTYDGALRLLHRAFDATAGYRLVAGDRARFLAEHARFAAADDEIARFFSASRRLFFGEDEAGARAELAPDALRRLARRLAALERGTA